MDTLTPYQESLRYIDNAKLSLKQAGKKDGEYDDVKYVQTAAGTAYVGTLLAIDEYLKRKEGSKYKKARSIEEYQIRLAKQDRKMLKLINSVYDSLHLAGYYHGTHSVKTIANGFEDALAIIEYIKE